MSFTSKTQHYCFNFRTSPIWFAKLGSMLPHFGFTPPILNIKGCLEVLRSGTAHMGEKKALLETRGSCVKSDKLLQVMSLRSVLVGTEHFKSEKKKSSPLFISA